MTGRETPATKGRFIVVEGPDGAGCSTQVRLLGQYLAELGIRSLTTREPTDGPFGVEIRKALQGRSRLNPYALALAFAADRADHADHYRFQPTEAHGEWLPSNTGIRAVLDQGIWVVSDRYVLSSLVYQTSQGLDPEWVTRINEHPMLVTPDTTLLISAPVEVYRQRLADRSLHLELFDEEESLAKVQRAYEHAIEHVGKRFTGVVATVSGMGTPEDISKQIVERLSQLFPELAERGRAMEGR